MHQGVWIISRNNKIRRVKTNDRQFIIIMKSKTEK